MTDPRRPPRTDRGVLAGFLLGGLLWAPILAAVGAVLGLGAWCAWASLTSL